MVFPWLFMWEVKTNTFCNYVVKKVFQRLTQIMLKAYSLFPAPRKKGLGSWMKLFLNFVAFEMKHSWGNEIQLISLILKLRSSLCAVPITYKLSLPGMSCHLGITCLLPGTIHSMPHIVFSLPSPLEIHAPLRQESMFVHCCILCLE